VSALDFSRFEVLTFDCFGTLIDWETGILRAACRTPPDDEFLEAYARHEADLEAGPYRRYREILAEALRAASRDLGVDVSDEEAETFAASVGDWPPFSDSAAGLAKLKERFALGVITNCDDDLFAAARERLGVEFDWVLTAEQARSYKPSLNNFELALANIGKPPDRICHVAQSLYHDHIPAKQLGLATVWVDRRGTREGFGATPPASTTPDLTVPDLKTLATESRPQL
jgi:2-haloacid dehalogenase